MPQTLQTDMCAVPEGSALDEFHFASWASFLRFALNRDDFRAEFEAETGEKFVQPPTTSFEMAIDEACGVDVSRQRYVHHFAKWATPKYFGDETELSPSILKVLSRADPT